MALLWLAPTTGVAKPPPTPASQVPQPSLVARGTPSASTLAADIEAANQREAACQQLLASKAKISVHKRDALLADCKASGADAGGGVVTMAITYDPSLDHCVDSTKTLCANPDVFHFIRRTFELTASSPLIVSTGDLQGVSGSTPDTVLYLVKCDTNACEAGDIVAIDDDIGGWPTNYASSITVNQPNVGWYAAYVVAYDPGRGGLCDLSVSQSGGVNFTAQDQRFSLWKVGPKRVRTGDVLVVAKNPGAASMATAGYADYHDSQLLIVSNPANDCTSQCGRAQFQDDTAFGGGATTHMTRMTIGSAFGGTQDEAKIMVGVFDTGTLNNGEFYRMHARLAHMRWGGTTGEADLDQDLITAEVEAQLGTCDSASDTHGNDLIVTGWDCQDARTWIDDKVNDLIGQSICGSSSDSRCWRPSDSDHDGIDDGDELFVAAVSCDSAPAGPYREADCHRVPSLYLNCDPDDWCAVEPSSGDMNSPFFGQDPTVYDVFVEADWIVSSSTDIDGGLDAHALSAAQQTELKELWGDEPAKCWDGAETETCPGATDLRYRVNMHAFPGTSWVVSDDRAQEEIMKGGAIPFVRSHFFARANRVLRFYHGARYGLALHQAGNGVSDRVVFQWGNDSGAAELARSPFSHEVGHGFGLDHRHFDPPQELLAQCGTPPNQTPCSWCTFDGSSCTPALPSHGCSTAPTGVTAFVENPAPTLMSYQYSGGMPPMQSAPPSSSQQYSVCSALNLRFSKGLLGRQLDEKALDNSWQPGNGWAEWQLRHLAQSQFCYQSFNDCRGLTSAFAVRPQSGAYFGPYCDVDGNGAATTCYFNWNGQTAQPTNTSTALGNTDITAGRWNKDSGVVSNQEVLEDEDEWARMISMGRQYLSKAVGRGMCLYANTFNGPQVDEDFCGWGETITVEGGMSASEVNYPMGGCADDGDCAGSGATCAEDPASCSQNADCLSNNCASGRCGCASDLECRSGQCVAGLCLTYWGGCSCQNNGECPDQDLGGDVCDQNNRCVAAREADAVIPPQSEAGQPWALRASAAFDGVDDRIRLHGGTNSRLEALSGSYEKNFTLHFDFRFDGFQNSETSHVLWKSAAFQLSVNSNSSVQATVAGHSALVWSGLQRGRWYRVIWSAGAGGQGHFIWLRRMDPKTGWYADAGDGSGGTCVYQTWTSALPSPGDVWIGHDGSSDASLYFQGRLDNVALVNFVPTARPSGCTLQQ